MTLVLADVTLTGEAPALALLPVKLTPYNTSVLAAELVKVWSAVVQLLAGITMVPSPQLIEYVSAYWLVLVMSTPPGVSKLVLLAVNDGIGVGVYSVIVVVAVLVDPLAPLAALPA